jgi:hypothetical protein
MKLPKHQQDPSQLPAYQFPLFKLRNYFGADEKNIRVCVQQSQEYKDYVAERQRSQAPPPPPEMSLLTRARIVACLRAEPPEIDKVRRMAGDHFRHREERKKDWPGRPYGLALALGLAWSSGGRLPAAWVELWLAFNKYGQRFRKDRLLRLRLARKGS